MDFHKNVAAYRSLQLPLGPPEVGWQRICDVEHEQQDPFKEGMSAISAGIWQEFFEKKTWDTALRKATWGEF